MKKIVIEFEEYTPSSGFSLRGVWDNDAAIKVVFDEKYPSVIITGNKIGLLSLGRTLIRLAQPEIPEGTHLHLDEGNLTTLDSKHMIIQIDEKLKAPLPG